MKSERKRLQDEQSRIRRDANAILNAAERAGRAELNQDEHDRFNCLMAQDDAVKKLLDIENQLAAAEKRLPTIIDGNTQAAYHASIAAGNQPENNKGNRMSTTTQAERLSRERQRHPQHWVSHNTTRFGDDQETTWLDSNGHEVQMLSPSQPMSNPSGRRLHLGKAIVGLVTGKWGEDSQAEKLAMGSNVNTIGGVLVNDELSAEVIDLARAKTVCIQAGARTIPMQSDRLTLAREITDPTIQVKGENNAFDEARLAFDGVGFSANTIGAVITMSRELAADAPNAAEIVQHALAGALAVSLDNYMLNGTGSAQPTGLILYGGVGSTGSIGAIAWEDLAAAVVGIATFNGTANAYIASPTIAGDLAALTSGDGTNSAKL